MGFRDGEFAESMFDMVCLFQTFEHMANQVKELNDIWTLIKLGGDWAIEVSILNNPLVSMYEINDFCNFWHQTPHLYYYDNQSLANVIAKTPF